MVTRRQFLKLVTAAGASLLMPAVRPGGWSGVRRSVAAPAAMGLSDPALQPLFQVQAPNALHPNFRFRPGRGGQYRVAIQQAQHTTGLVDPSGNSLSTTIFGYGYDDGRGVTWPGRTFEVTSGDSRTMVSWYNQLGNRHLLPVDTNLHWAYSLYGYDTYSIEQNGVPIITHLHGGHSDFQFDGTPEFFYSPGAAIVGPQWARVPGGFTTDFAYDNNVPAGTLWYHDHTLGITRLNVYAGLAGFYIVRDEFDTGTQGNPLGLPAFPYELAYAIQDRMFRANGELFYPAFPGDPFYDDFITDEEAELPEDRFPGGGPTVLAEFFGDHIVVNGKIWPKEDVQPRNYRLRLLNGTDSRFMALQFVAVNSGDTDFSNAGEPIPFYAIGSDQGLASSATLTDMLLFEPGSRYDIVFDFKGLRGRRIIMKNIGGDEPFGGDIPGPRAFEFTDRIMAFDVADVPDLPDRFDPAAIGHYGGNTAGVDRVRKVALFEGEDQFGRLQPLLGTAEPATDFQGNPILWPDEPAYRDVGLVGQMEGTAAWHSPTTENPALNATEVWEIHNATMDAHPIHLHLVNVQVLDRHEFSATIVPQPLVQHDGTIGQGARLLNIELGAQVPAPAGYVENAPKDVVIALPGQVTRIKATFDKPGHYAWHCHILSHEDHEMMRVLHVGPIPGHGGAVAADAALSDVASLPPEESNGRVFLPHITKR